MSGVRVQITEESEPRLYRMSSDGYAYSAGVRIDLDFAYGNHDQALSELHRVVASLETRIRGAVASEARRVQS